MSASLMWMALTALAAAGTDVRPVSEVWPYEAKRLPDGKVQLSYDLTGLKAGILDTEAASELDEPSLKALATKLPKEAKVILDYAGVPISLEVATARERAPPAVSFAAVPSSALASTVPLETKAGARILPALHPEMAKLWVSLDASMWKARHANESILAGIAVAAEDGALGLPMGAKAFWQAVLKAALDKAAASEGDAKEGAQALAAHVAGALKRQGGALPAAIAKNEQWNNAVEERINAVDEDKFSGATSLRSTFTPALRRMELRDRMLAFALPDSRPGKAAALTFLVLLEKDAKLAAAYDALATLRDTFIGVPAKDELLRWRKLAKEQGGAAAAMDDLAAFLSAAQKLGLGMPSLFAASSSPIEAALDGNGGAALENARDDLVVSLQQGGLNPPSDDGAAWLSLVDAAMSSAVATPLKTEKPAVTRSRFYRDRVNASFLATLPAPALEIEADSDDGAAAEDRRPYGLKVALKVPPVFAVEPSPQFFARSVKAYERLEKLLATTGKAATISGVLPGGGKRASNNKAEAQRLKRLFRGLELHVAGQAASTPEDKESQKVADAFIAGWRKDPDLSADVRFAAELRGEGQLLIYGVTRQLVRVKWEEPPRTSIVGKDAAEILVVDSDAPQKYVTPVLVTGQPHYPGTLPDRATFKAISDRAKREPAAVDASLAPGP